MVCFLKKMILSTKSSLTMTTCLIWNGSLHKEELANTDVIPQDVQGHPLAFLEDLERNYNIQVWLHLTLLSGQWRGLPLCQGPLTWRRVGFYRETMVGQTNPPLLTEFERDPFMTKRRSLMTGAFKMNVQLPYYQGHSSNWCCTIPNTRLELP